MIKVLIFILIALINAIACSACCGTVLGPITIKEYNASELIISGKVTKITSNEKESIEMQQQIEFQIDEVYKGKINLKKVIVYTPLCNTFYGLLVNENEEWVFWARIQNNAIKTDICSRSKQKKYLSEYDFKVLKYFQSCPPTIEWKNEQGTIIAVGTLKDNEPVGYWKYFYNNGYIESEGYYNNGIINGKWIKYLDPEGIVIRLKYDKKIPDDSIPDLQMLQHKILEIQNYNNGVMDGEFIYYAYHSIDKPKRIVNYKNGRLYGKSIAYYDNGIVYYEQNYKDNKLEGYERFYHLNGHLKQVGKFIQNKPIGEFKVYNELGELIKTTIDRRPD